MLEISFYFFGVTRSDDRNRWNQRIDHIFSDIPQNLQEFVLVCYWVSCPSPTDVYAVRSTKTLGCFCIWFSHLNVCSQFCRQARQILDWHPATCSCTWTVTGCHFFSCLSERVHPSKKKNSMVALYVYSHGICIFCSICCHWWIHLLWDFVALCSVPWRRILLLGTSRHERAAMMISLEGLDYWWGGLPSLSTPPDGL